MSIAYTPKFAFFGSIDTQAGLQITIVVLTLVCIFWLIIPKPLILYKREMERVNPRRFSNRISRRTSVPEYPSESSPQSYLNIQDGFPNNLQNTDPLLSPGIGRQNNEYYELSDISTLFRDSILEEILTPARFMDILIEHLVRVLKFVVGSISGVVSYLRLWGLSMAHYHLSKILVDTIL